MPRPNGAQNSPSSEYQMQHLKLYHRSPSSDHGLVTADCAPTCIATVCHTQSAAHVRQAHKAQNVLCTKLQALVYDIFPLEEGARKRCSESDSARIRQAHKAQNMLCPCKTGPLGPEHTLPIQDRLTRPRTYSAHVRQATRPRTCFAHVRQTHKAQNML